MNQRTYSLEEHLFPANKIDPDALSVMEKLRAHGFQAYLVGGSVRDLLLDRKPKDFDISTSAEPEEIKKIFRNSILVGRRFRLAHIRFGKKVLEVSTFRSGNNEADTLIVRDNKWGTPEEDAMRRDFTINGLFYDPATQQIIDYVEGYPDLQKGLLRTIGQPFIRFRQDPVRMLRLLKFQARFNFEVESSAHIALLECRHEMTKSSPARIQEELLRMLESGSSEPFFRLMTEHGLIQLMTPVLGEFLESSEGEDVFAYLKEIDTTFHDPSLSPLPRPILLTSLIFPLMERRLRTHFLDRNIIPHLGEVFKEAKDLVHEIFHPFFSISKKLRASLLSILTSQFRISPFEQKKYRRIRIPNDPEFGDALTFFSVRCALEPALQTTYQEWNAAFSSLSSPPSPRRQRKRRRPSQKNSQPTTP